MDHMLYQIFKIILSIFKKTTKNIDNPSIRICVNKVKNRITFKINFFLSKNGERVSHLEVAEVVLIHCNIVNNDFQ